MLGRMSTTLRMVVCADPGMLLEHAAAEFLSAVPTVDPFPSPPHLLVLRQGGLRDDLHALAAARGVPGWFDPPVCVFHELPEWLGSTALKPLGDFERAALLEHLLRQHGGGDFRDREGVFLSSIERLFGELRAERVEPDAWDAAVAAQTQREEFEQRRDTAIGRVYRFYVDLLAREGRRDGRDTLADMAAAVRADPDAFAARLSGRREIRVVGLADLRGGWRLLLDALCESPALDRISLYHTGRLPLDVPLELLEGARRVTKFDLVGALDETSELEAIAARVRRLIDAGARADSIAVVSRDGRPHTDLALHALAAAGVPATARQRVGLLTIPSVRAVIALLDAAAAGWTRHVLAGLGSQPYFAADLDERIINYIGYCRRVTGLGEWTAALDTLLAEAQAAEAWVDREDERRPRSLPVAWVERARERFASFARNVQPMDSARPLAGWLAWLAQWLEDDPWRMEERIGRVPDDRWRIVRLDLLGWRQLHSVVRDWADAERAWPGDAAPLTAAAFVERLRIMLAGDVALWTESSRGVQVAEALAVSHRTFDHVFLVGMDAGRFPKRAPSSMLLGERDREALREAGLPLETTAEWEARERGLFDTLVAGARTSLTVSFRRLDDLGGASNPSGFVESLRETLAVVDRPAVEMLVGCSPDLAAHARRVALIERERATGRLSPWNGGIESESLRAWLAERFGPEFVWSPTSLEAYAKCPWSWFAERLLRLAASDDPDQDMDARVRGSVMHDALHRFYDGARERTGGPVFLMPADRPWALALLRESLRAALAHAGETLWLGHPSLREVKYAELERMLVRYLDFEMDENQKSFDGRTTAGKTVRTAVDAHEVSFDDARLERDGVVLRYRGIIDRIEVGQDDRAPGNWVAAVDYKAGKWSVPAAGGKGGWADGVVLQVPLYAHALARLRPGSDVSRVEYRAIKQAQRLHSLSLIRVKKAGVDSDAEAAALMESALSAAVQHVRRVGGGEFPAAPAPSCHCSPYCQAWDICRVKGGPDDGRDW
jgi:hypothetical protein